MSAAIGIAVLALAPEESFPGHPLIQAAPKAELAAVADSADAEGVEAASSIHAEDYPAVIATEPAVADAAGEGPCVHDDPPEQRGPCALIHVLLPLLARSYGSMGAL